MSTKYTDLRVSTCISQKRGTSKVVGTSGSCGREGCLPSASTCVCQAAAQSGIHWNGAIDPRDTQRINFGASYLFSLSELVKLWEIEPRRGRNMKQWCKLLCLVFPL